MEIKNVHCEFSLSINNFGKSFKCCCGLCCCCCSSYCCCCCCLITTKFAIELFFFLFFARSTNYLDKDFDSTMAVAVALSANERESLFSFAALSPARHVKVQEQIVYYIII